MPKVITCHKLLLLLLRLLLPPLCSSSKFKFNLRVVFSSLTFSYYYCALFGKLTKKLSGWKIAKNTHHEQWKFAFRMPLENLIKVQKYRTMHRGGDRRKTAATTTTTTTNGNWNCCAQVPVKYFRQMLALTPILNLSLCRLSPCSTLLGQ